MQGGLATLISPLFSFQGVDPGRRPVGQAVKTEASHASNVGSIPARVTSFALHAPLAQLVEHLTLNQGVQGSSP